MKKWLGLILTIGVLVSVAAGCSKDPTPQDRFSQYIQLWNEKKFDQMYSMLSSEAKKTISQKEYVSRYQKIYQDLQISDLKVSFKSTEGRQTGEGHNGEVYIQRQNEQHRWSDRIL